MSTRAILKGFFEIGDKPTQIQFYDLIDSLFHKTEDTLDWSAISGKPTTFAPSAHSHVWGDITGKPTTFAPSAHTHLWADITDKPTTFAPAAHVHSAGEITTGLFHPARLGAGMTTDGYMIQLVSGVPTWVVAPSGGSSAWGLSGNSGTSAGSNYIGTSDAQPLYFKVNGGTVAHLGAGNGSLMMGLSTNGTATARNTIYGDFAGGGGLSGTDAAAFGRLALYQSSGIGLSAFGQGAGYASAGITGNYLSFFGFETQADSAGLSNATAIGANTHIAQSNTVILGNNCDVGIRTKTPSYALDVNGTARIVTVPTITTATKMLVKDPTTGQVSEQLLPTGGGSGWGLTGNAGTGALTNFIGTTDSNDFVIKTNNVQTARFGYGGEMNFGIGSIAGFLGLSMGYLANAGNQGIAGGRESYANTASLGMGYHARAEGVYSMALHSGSKVTHAYSTLINDGFSYDSLGSFCTSENDRQFKAVFNSGFLFNSLNGTNTARLGAATGVSLDLSEATRYMMPNRGTTSQRTSLTPSASAIYYDTTLNKLFCYDGTAWQPLF